MAEGCCFYYITDRTAFASDEPTRRKRVLDKIAEAAQAGVDFIQLREKDLPARDLEALALEAVARLGRLRNNGRQLKTALLINSRTDIALAAGADGVHLRSDDISPEEIRTVWRASFELRKPSQIPAQSAAAAEPVAGFSARPLIGVSCHSLAEVQRAADAGARVAVFGPVFEKKNSPEIIAGLKLLEEACRVAIPVLALGGINLENAQACLEVGAAGIAAIRLFQENDVTSIVRRLRD